MSRIADLRTIGEVKLQSEYLDHPTASDTRVVLFCRDAFPGCIEEATDHGSGFPAPRGVNAMGFTYQSAQLAERAAKAWRHLIRLAREAQPDLDDDPFK